VYIGSKKYYLPKKKGTNIMLAAVDQEIRSKITEASEGIVEPFKKVVGVAMKRVREGKVDSLQRQRVGLFHEEENRIYLVTDVSVRYEGLRRKVISDRRLGLEGGLFVDGIQLDKTGSPLRRLVTIQIPRDVNITNSEMLYLQRSSDPLDVERLAKELKEAKKVQISEYYWASSVLAERKARGEE
jgi:hypothetical protein